MAAFPPLIYDTTDLLRENSSLCLYSLSELIYEAHLLFLLLHNNGFSRWIKGFTSFAKMRGYSPLLPLISCILLLMSINYQSYFSKSLYSTIPVSDHSQEGLFLNIIISSIIFNLLWYENQGQTWYKVRDGLLWWVLGDVNEGLNHLFSLWRVLKDSKSLRNIEISLSIFFLRIG